MSCTGIYIGCVTFGCVQNQDGGTSSATAEFKINSLRNEIRYGTSPVVGHWS